MKKKIIPGFIVVLVSYLLFTQIAIETGDPKQAPNLIETGWLQAQQFRASSPNIILIMTDDLGWTSVSYRSDPERADSKSDYIETPHMARAAEAGVKAPSGIYFCRIQSHHEVKVIKMVLAK